jgi:hypothetical protein
MSQVAQASCLPQSRGFKLGRQHFTLDQADENFVGR